MIRHRDDRTHKRMERALHARFEKLMVDGSASQNIVIPAKAGIQVLNGSRAMRAISTANCGSPHRGRVSFFARAKKETKESTPRMAQPFPLRLRLRGKAQGAHPCAPVRAATGSAHPSPPRLWVPRCPDATSCRGGAGADIPVCAPFGALAQSLTGLGCAIRVWKKTVAPLAVGVFGSP